MYWRMRHCVPVRPYSWAGSVTLCGPRWCSKCPRRRRCYCGRMGFLQSAPWLRARRQALHDAHWRCQRCGVSVTGSRETPGASPETTRPRTGLADRAAKPRSAVSRLSSRRTQSRRGARTTARDGVRPERKPNLIRGIRGMFGAGDHETNEDALAPQRPRLKFV